MGRGPTFHLSCYLTLGLASVCLGFAEWLFLKWVLVYVGLLGALFALAWKYEGRWELSEQGANLVGLVIAFGMLGWIVFQLPRTEQELVAARVDWPAGLLPYLGPLLMILTAVKLFRPKKTADFWTLQILGVMMVTLASVLAGTVDHGLWVFLYLVSLVWCLTQYQRMQSTWAGLSDEQRRRAPLFAPEGLTSGGGLIRDVGPALALAIAVTGVGGLLFVLAPRFVNANWNPRELSASTSGRISTGLEAGMDLNRTGKIELSEEVAFEVVARDGAGNAVSLPPDVYWRGETLDFYQHGRWYPGSSAGYAGSDGQLDGMPWKALWKNNPDKPSQANAPPDDMPAGKTHLAIHVLVGMPGNLVLAEPLDVKLESGRAPIIGSRRSPATLFTTLVGADTVVSARTRRESYRYGQVVDFKASAKRQPAGMIQTRYLESYFEQSPPVELLDWSRSLLARQESLTSEEKTLDADLRVPGRHRAKVAQAISQHFAGSGEYLYSLNLRRVESSKDPNVDFLMNVKEGHCERYASGLALTLRGLGIPSRVVHGFRGGDVDEEGTIVVRFNQAHSWVQALAPTADGKGNEWLLLDPTPSQEVALDRWQAFGEWLETGLRGARDAFRIFVLDYGSDQQKTRLKSWWASLKETLTDGTTLAIGFVAAAAIGAWVGKKRLARWWSNRQTARPELPWLADALAIVADKTGLAPTPNQTLLEFASRLGGTAFGPAFDALAAMANRVRFGGHSLSADDRHDIAANIGRLKNEPRIPTTDHF